MQEVIDYRIGLNNSDDIFDFSLHQLIRGLSARRITTSFFKPLLAASIYKHFIGNEVLNPVVFDPCCGFGGTFAVKFEAISAGMADQKLTNALATGAEYIISTDLSCLMQLDGFINNKNLQIKTIHIADVLASGWE